LVCIGLAVLVFFVHHNRRILQDDFHKKYLKRPGWKKRNAKMSVAICLLLLVTAAVPATLTFSGTVRTRFAPEKVAWDVWGESSMVNAIREFDGSVIVHKGGMLEIRDCRVRFNVAALGETRFYIQWGGSLKVINSTISADKYFEFYIGGRAEIQDSTIRRTYGTGSESGIRIGSDNVTIKRTTVERGMHNGITIRYSQALIEDCTIQHNPGAGLETVSSKSIISNNTIRNNGRGVMMDESTDAFQDNTVQNNSGDGLLMVDSSPFLGNNSFIDNRGYAIALAGQSYPIFSDNLFQNNRYGALGNRTFEDSNRWTLVFIAVSMFVPMISLMVVSETRKGLLKKIEKGR
jgi:parallel beta-helix repeat protein